MKKLLAVMAVVMLLMTTADHETTFIATATGTSQNWKGTFSDDPASLPSLATVEDIGGIEEIVDGGEEPIVTEAIPEETEISEPEVSPEEEYKSGVEEPEISEPE